MKGEGGIPPKTEEVRAYATMLENQEPLTIKQLLLDLECGADLVDSILNGHEDGDSDANGVNFVYDRDSDNGSTRNGGDIEDDASC